jgi:hypothetical protein
MAGMLTTVSLPVSGSPNRVCKQEPDTPHKSHLLRNFTFTSDRQTAELGIAIEPMPYDGAAEKNRIFLSSPHAASSANSNRNPFIIYKIL